MAFHHLSGVTTPGAPDSVVDWFAAFEVWITGTVGWIVATGTGTTDLFIRSIGELGGLTMLFVHLWRDVGNPNLIHVEVSDDAVAPLGTHSTSEGGTVDSGGVQFAYWMSADKDALVIVWKAGAGYKMLYGGLVMPFALTVVDETYQMIANSSLTKASILRRHDHVWDQDDDLYYNTAMRLADKDRDDGSLAIGGTYFGDHADIGGQLKFISCEITEPTVTPEDTMTTGQPGATSEWVVLLATGKKFALRTGGVLSTGRADGSFASVSGIAGTLAAWFGALVALMVGRGWAATDISGATGFTWDYEFNSAGEDGTEDIWIRVYCGTPGDIRVFVADSAFGTGGRHEIPPRTPKIADTDFPRTYYFSADKDCLVQATQEPLGNYYPIFSGLASVFAPGLSSTYMKSVSMGGFGGVYPAGWILQGHDGAWVEVIACVANGDGVHCTNSQPSNYDGTTYLVWPYVCKEGDEVIGQMKYFFTTHGGGVAQNDTITVGPRIYTVMFPGAGMAAMRTT